MRTSTTFAAAAALLAPSFAQFIEDTAYGPAPAGCADFEVIFTRGTGEPGPFGTIVGDPLIKTIIAAVPNARGYATQYPATEGDGSYDTGVKDIVNRINTKSKECPNMKWALSGYSQGAYIQRGATEQLAQAELEKILAVVAFGDPGISVTNLKPAAAGQDPSLKPFPKILWDRLREFCAKGDPVCGGASDFVAHLVYGGSDWQKAASDFIIAGLKGTPMPAKQDGHL